MKVISGTVSTENGGKMQNIMCCSVFVEPVVTEIVG